MKLREILKKCSPYLGIGEIADTAESVRLIAAANSVYGALFTGYSSMVAVEEVTLIGGVIPYSALSHRVNKVIGVTKFAAEVSFLMTENGIKPMASGEVIVTYSYYPEQLELDSEVMLCDAVNEYAFVYLLLSEYALMEGDFDKAKLYYDKYLVTRDVIGRVKQRTMRSSRWL